MNTQKKYRYINDFVKSNYHKGNEVKYFLGFIIYIFLFVFIIPTILFKLKFFDILEVYLPNIDLLATVLSYHEGPFNIWRKLYMPTAITISSFFYQTSINYIALIGLTYIICRETKLTKNIYKGWSLAFVMLLITYLLPSQIITHLMNNFEKYLNSYKEISLLCLECKRIYILIFGLLLILFLILFEKYIIVNFRKYLIKTGKYVINFPL